MTTVDTMDTQGSIEQAIRMVEAGCEYVRITAPSIKEAQNLAEIRKGLHLRGYKVPLIADIHFTPNAAELAARLVEKVRINPGNYADKKRFQKLEYTDAEYQNELSRIRDKFMPLVTICKEYGTAMRIGTNHGSLSDRIMSRYGDTPLGMVESALEFVRICEDLGYYEIVLSMKASNPQVMVQAYRLLVNRLDEEGLKPYPLHLGVTEAGEGEDGRIKSALGIGALLEDGLGDTVRVSLTEEPEIEAPVAQLLVDRYISRPGHRTIPSINAAMYDPFSFARRTTREILNIGGSHHIPRVVADFSKWPLKAYQQLKSIGHFYIPATDKWYMNDQGADYIYTGDNPVTFMLPNGLKEICNYNAWKETGEHVNRFPVLNAKEFMEKGPTHPQLNFVRLQLSECSTRLMDHLNKESSVVLLLHTDNDHAMAELRRVFLDLRNRDIQNPVIIQREYSGITEDQVRLYAATDVGCLMIDGFGDGVMLSMLDSAENAEQKIRSLNKMSFGILQATRGRMSKTEYISCPSCGRTLFDLQETTSTIRRRTEHLKGVKIGIMGCIVNGPGEMADADYGYVGSGPGRITLYRGKEVVKRNVPSTLAVDELIQLIRNDGNWTEVDENSLNEKE